MPTVPNPNSSAFGGGGLPQAQRNLGTAVIGLGNQMGAIARDLANRENKAKYREDAQTRVSDLQSKAKPLLTQINQKWLATNPSTRGDKDTLKAEIDSALNDLLAPKVYHFKESKIEYANALDEMATSILTKAGKVINENGIVNAKRKMEQSVGNMAEHLRRSPKAFLAILVKFKKEYERDGAALGKDGGDFFRSKVVQLATIAQDAYIELGDVDAADVIANIPEVSNSLKVEERVKLWATADGARNIASKDARQAGLDRSLKASRDASTEHSKVLADIAKWKLAGMTGSRPDTKKEEEILNKMERDATEQLKRIEKIDIELENLRDQDTAKSAEEEKKLMQKLIPQTQQLLKKHQTALNNGEFTQESARVLLDKAVEYMTEQRPRPGFLPVPPPGYAAALQSMGININSYIKGSAAAIQDTDETISKFPSIAGDVKRVTAKLLDTVDQQAPASAGQDQQALAGDGQDPALASSIGDPAPGQDPALASAGQDPALASSIGDPAPASNVDNQQAPETAEAQEHQKMVEVIPEISPITEHVFDKANTVENDDTGQAINALKNISDSGMTVHNLVSLTHGFSNTMLRNMYENSLTAVFIPEQNEKTIAAQRLKGAVRMLVLATKRDGKFTDSYREWLLGHFEALQPGMFKNEEAAKSAVEGIASVLVDEAVIHLGTIEKAKAGGDPNLSPKAGQIATNHIKDIRQMLDVLGAPIPITGYAQGTLSSEQHEAAKERVRNLVKVGILKAEDRIKIDGRIAIISGDE